MGKDDKVKKRKMKEKLDLSMPKNGQMKAGWERARPRAQVIPHIPADSQGKRW